MCSDVSRFSKAAKGHRARLIEGSQLNDALKLNRLVALTQTKGECTFPFYRSSICKCKSLSAKTLMIFIVHVSRHVPTARLTCDDVTTLARDSR